MKINKLYIMCAGLSSRMGGNPKHLCYIGDKRNIQNTVELAQDAGYTDIYIFINKNLDKNLKDITSECIKDYDNVFIREIESGKGDAHAVNEALKYNSENDIITVVWGDTFFFTKKAFKNSLLDIKNGYVDFINVFCAFEEDPYCYANIEKQKSKTEYCFSINNMEFKSEGLNENGDYQWHDQSMFNINVKVFKHIYNSYCKYIDNIKNYIKIKDFEYSIIKLMNWSQIHANCICLDSSISKSFNTPEELENIINKM